MHRHITYYTQSTICQGGFSNKFLSSTVVHGRMQDLLRGAIYFFFFFWGGGVCDAWRSHAFARGVWAPAQGGGAIKGRRPPPSKIMAILGAFLLLFFHTGAFLLLFLIFGGLFTMWGPFCYSLLHGGRLFWGLPSPPPLRKFLRAPMIAGGFESMLPGNFFV